MKIGIGAIVVMAFLLNSGGRAATYYVSTSGDDSDGLSWPTAKQSMGEALVLAASGDSVWVRSGTYTELVTLGFGIGLYGGFEGTEGPSEFSLRDPATKITVIDGRIADATGDTNGCGNPFSSFKGATVDAFPGSVLDGFTVYGGHCGAYIADANNWGRTTLVPVRIENCRILAFGETDLSYAILLNRANCYIQRSYIKRVMLEGVSASCISTSGGLTFELRCENCVISYDIRPSSLDDPSLEPFYPSQAIFSSVLRVWLTNCSLYRSPGSDVLSFRISDGFDQTLNHFIITNTIITGGIDEAGFGSEIQLLRPDVNHSNIGGGYPGEGNIDADPLFVDPENDDFRLLKHSPCIDTGTTVALTEDIEGNPRPRDIPGVGHDGEGAYDMGAYEFQRPFRNSLSDINWDGEVDARDLYLLIQDWHKVSDTQ